MSEDIKFKLGVDGSAFKRGVTSVRADMKRFVSETASDWKQAFSFAAAVAGMRELGVKMAALKRQSEDIGASTDFLQSLGRMSVKFGGQAEEADNALIKLAESMGQARTEGGAAEEKFTKFGIALYNANGEAKTTEEVFKNIADRYRNATDAATKAAIAFEFFGKTGRNINNILGEGADGIENYTAQMRRYGLVASETNVARVAEAWADLQTNITGAGTSLAGWTLRLLDAQQRVSYFIRGMAGEFSFSNFIDQISDALSGQGATELQRARQADEEAQRRGILAKKADEDLGKKNLELEKKLADERFDGLSDQWKIVELEIQLKELLDEEVDLLATENEEKSKLLKIDEKRMQIEKLKAGLAEKQAKAMEEQKQAAADLQIARMDKLGALLEQRKTAQETIADRTRFSMEELAGANLRGVSDPALRSDILKARQVRELTGRAEQLRLSGRAGSLQEAADLFTRADKIRQGITSLRSEERLTSMDKNIAEVNQGIQEFNNLAKETGFYVRPLIGK